RLAGPAAAAPHLHLVADGGLGAHPLAVGRVGPQHPGVGGDGPLPVVAAGGAAPERQQARGREAGGRCGLLGGGRGGRRGADDERPVGRPGQVVGRVGVVPDELDHLVGGGGAAEDEGGDEHQRAEAPAVVAGGEVG